MESKKEWKTYNQLSVIYILNYYYFCGIFFLFYVCLHETNRQYAKMHRKKKDAFVQINMGMASSCQGSVTSG